jgi:homoserine O-acetyltransferase/O-succinyltransferase
MTAATGIVEKKYFSFAEPPHEMELESGAKLGPVTLAWESHGELNADRANAILILHALSGDSHVAGRYAPEDRKPGWWDSMVGPGKAFDTDKYFVICTNVLGGCMGSTGPASINPATGKAWGLDFPVITIGDMVNAQRELVRHLGIEKLLAVAGGSMGGMQALEWAVRYPEAVKSAIIISASYMNGAQQIAFHAVGRHAIQADPDFAAGNYGREKGPENGLAIARMLAHITYLSDESMRAKFGRRLMESGGLRYDLQREFSVESYLDYQGEQFVNRFDANTYLYVSKAIDYFDLARSYGSLDAAMARIQGKVMILSFSSDWLYPPYQSEEMVYTLARQNRDVTYCNIASDYGHDAFLLETEAQTRLIEGFLKYTEDPGRPCENRCEENPRPAAGPPAAAFASIYRSRRVDYDMIVDLVETGSRVLDIGCGNGELLCRLRRLKQVRGMGLELNQENVVSTAACGIPVVQADIDRGLEVFEEASFDYVVLSMTLQVVRNPDLVLREMLRAGRKCIVSFPNFGLWRVRVKTALLGRAPVTRNLPYAWHQSPNRHVLTIRDFREFCRERGIRIEQEIALTADGPVRLLPNMRAEEALYVIARE